MNIEIRTMTAADLDVADAIFMDAFGVMQSNRASLELVLSLQPDSRLLALAEGAPVGIVGAVDFGPFAYIGAMGVRREWQQRGIGYALMKRLVEELDARGCPMSRLDASAAGQHLYPKLGFVTDEETYRFNFEGPARSGHIPEQVQVARAQDLDAIAMFDTPIFGVRRDRVFQHYYAWLKDRTLLTRDKTGHVSGYLFAQTRAVGPWAAHRPLDAAALLAAALSLSYETPPVVRVPSSNSAAIELLLDNGFQLTETLAHMRRGGDKMPGNRTLLYGLASFSIG